MSHVTCHMSQTVFSGVQPSGNLHIGNYLGYIKHFVELQHDNEAIFFVADEHAITVPQDPKELRAKTLEVAKLYLACGVDPQKSVVFIQSHIPAHAELAWILNTMTPLGELERMTQFKDKKEAHGVLAGLLNYPTLMAADILLYQSDSVPVGEDQLQHIELTRTLAEKFNNRFGKTFKIPKALINKDAARIMGLDNADKKMSKSAISEYNYISILEKPEDIRRKIKSAVTDSGSEIKYDLENKAAVSNLLTIFSGFSGKTISDLEKEYAGKRYSEFKDDLAELLVDKLGKIQEKYNSLSDEEMAGILKEGAKKAKKIANKTLRKAKKKLGFYLK